MSQKILFILVFIELAAANINFKWLNYNQQLKQQKILNTQQVFYGNFLFDSSSDQSSNISNFALSGWFWPRIEISGIYDFFKLKQNSEELVSIQFLPDQNKLRQSVLGQFSQDNYSAILHKDIWVLIVLQLSSDGASINVQTSLHQTQQYQIFQIGPLSYSYNKYIQKQNFILSIGYSFTIDGYYESLAYINNLYIFWNNLNFFDNYSYSYDLTALQTEMVWNYDFFYTKANPNQYFNVAQSMNIYSNGYQSNSQVLLLQVNSVFKTDFSNPLEFGGFAVSFHFKVSSLVPTNIILMTVLNANQLFQIKLDSTQSKIYLNSQSVNGIDFSKWNQVTLILKTVITYDAYLIVYGYESQIQKVQISQFLFGQLQFGDTSNTQTIQLSHIRYYRGTQFTSNQQNCFLQTDNSECLICKTGFYINYQSSLNCQNQSLPSVNVNKDNIIDWNENFPDCTQNMIYDQNTFQCVCMKQFYLSKQNTCEKCPSYCNECFDENTCKIKDNNRLENGKCPKEYFDDGYSCIIQKLTIYGSNNIENQISQCVFNLNNDQIKLNQNGIQSFYFSFSVNFQGSNAYGMFGAIYDSNNEIFTFSYISPGGLPSIQLQVLGVPIYTASIRNNLPIWIALWTNLQQVFLQINTYSKFSSAQRLIKSKIILTNPRICLGQCQAGYLNYLCNQFNSRSFRFISNMTNPNYDTTTLQTFMSEPVKNLAKFEIHLKSDITQIFNNLQTQQSSLKLQFQPPSQYDSLKGFKFNQQQSAVISNILNDNYYWISFYCTILPVMINQQVSLLSYALNAQNSLWGNKLEIFLVPYGQKLSVRICYLIKCIDSKYSMLNMNESNSLFIFMRTQSPFSLSFNFIEFDVVCNYQREQMQFIHTVLGFTLNSITLQLGLQLVNTADYLFYLNLINVDKGDGLYYFDYNLEEPCFIFNDLQSMTCLYYKNKLISYNNNQITEAQCLNLTKELEQTFFVNQQTRECLNTNQLFYNCKIVDFINNQFQCLQCASDFSDLYNNCQCIDGYYMESNTNTCLKCLPQCKTCSGKRDSCTECNNIGQSIPSCQCVDSSYFLNDQNQCQKCSEKCGSCIGNENFCITCSQKRTNPPDCECDYQKYQEVSNTCVQLQCDKNCEQCIYDFSLKKVVCIKCKSGRINPPKCDCISNYTENNDGTCSTCSFSQYYDEKQGICKNCVLPCLQCKNSSDTCTSCVDGLDLISNTCGCQNGLSLQKIQGNQGSYKYSCIQSMNVKLSIQMKNSLYYLIFTFDYQIKQIDFQNNEIKDLITINLAEVQQLYYQIVNPEINGNQLILQINVLQNIKATNGQAIFLQTDAFVSSDNQYILSSFYKKNPLIFQLGPILFKESIFDKNLSKVVSQIKSESNKNILNAIQSTQFIFYFLNTVQPINLFLLLNLNFPPNLYMLYQIAGSFTFPDVVDYLSTNYKQIYNIFGYQFNETEVHLIDRKLYKRIGLSNTLLVNAPIIIIKYGLLFFLIFIIKLLEISINRTFKKNVDSLQTINSFLKQRINAENETNLLLSVICIFLQFTSLDQELWSVRYGYYLAITLMITFIFSFIKNYYEINHKKNHQKSMFSISFLDRLQNFENISSSIGRNYFLIQHGKKYLVILVLMALQNNPFGSCIVVGTIFWVSSILTLKYKPYLNTTNRMVKFIGELLFSIIWFIHIQIFKLEQILNKQTQIEQETVDFYLISGNVIIILLLIYNIIYLIQYPIEILIIIKSKCCSKRIRKTIKTEQSEEQTFYQINNTKTKSEMAKKIDPQRNIKFFKANKVYTDQ